MDIQEFIKATKEKPMTEIDFRRFQRRARRREKEFERQSERQRPDSAWFNKTYACND